VGPDEEFVVLLSGGASALWAEPAPPLEVPELVRTTSLLLGAGIDIHGLNAVRKHLTRVSGGRLAEAVPGAAAIRVLVLSDVPGDDLATIGSGPCEPDPTTYHDARAAIEAVGAWMALPEDVRRHLEEGCAGTRNESPKPGAPWAARVDTRILASNATALQAIEVAASAQGLPVRRDPLPLRGEAREAGRRLAARATEPGAAPTLWIAGGETAVTVRGDGKGGRSQELALAAALAWEGADVAPDTLLLAAGTDGTDGPTEAAGAFADPGTASRGRERGVDPEQALARNDSHRFFDAEGGLFVTGPTRTNVMDLALLSCGLDP